MTNINYKTFLYFSKEGDTILTDSNNNVWSNVFQIDQQLRPRDCKSELKPDGVAFSQPKPGSFLPLCFPSVGKKIYKGKHFHIHYAFHFHYNNVDASKKT
jgi:hypothetical protein